MNRTVLECLNTALHRAMRADESVILLGEDILMYASDYPHGESWFPKSVETVLGWKMSDERKRKLFWDNAVRLYARAGFSE